MGLSKVDLQAIAENVFRYSESPTKETVAEAIATVINENNKNINANLEKEIGYLLAKHLKR